MRSTTELHYFRVDRPFLDSQGRRLENFTRVEMFGNNAPNGNNDVHWVKVLVGASQPGGLHVPGAGPPRRRSVLSVQRL